LLLKKPEETGSKPELFLGKQCDPEETIQKKLCPY